MVQCTKASLLDFWKAEVPIEQYIEQMDNQMIINVLKKLLINLFQSMKAFIVVHTIEIIILIITTIAFIYIATKVWKGRHRYSQLDKEKETKNKSISVHITNTNTSESRNSSITSSTTPTVEINQMINKPEILVDKTNIDIWLVKMEIYLKSIEKQHWYGIAISYIDNKFIKEENLETKDLENQFETLKQQLLKIATTSKAMKTEKMIDYKAIGDRKQNLNETVEEYGNNLIQMATKLFPNVDIEAQDESLKSQFANGLNSEYLREKLNWRILKQRRKSEKFTIKDAIAYAKDQNEAYQKKIKSDKQQEGTSTETNSINQGSTNTSSIPEYNNNEYRTTERSNYNQNSGRYFNNFNGYNNQNYRKNNYNDYNGSRAIERNYPNNQYDNNNRNNVNTAKADSNGRQDEAKKTE